MLFLGQNSDATAQGYFVWRRVVLTIIKSLMFLLIVKEQCCQLHI